MAASAGSMRSSSLRVPVGVDVDGREDALVGQLAVEADLHVAGALELLEDDLVHARAGVDQRRGEDGERAAELDVAGRAEELLGRVQRRASRRRRRGCGREAGVFRLKARAMRVMESSSTTTSSPISTRRLTRSSTSSVTCTWFSDGWSKVLDTTVPLTERCMSVTSSGRSSTSRTMRSTSGLLAVIELASFFRMVVLPALGGETIRPRWPLPIGHSRSMMRAAVSCSCGLEAQALLGEQRRELLEQRPLAGGVGVDAVDGVDLEQGVVLLVVLGLAHLAGDLVAAAQAEAADLAERHVDVVVALHEAVRAQKAEAVGQHVEDADLVDRRRFGTPLARFALGGLAAAAASAAAAATATAAAAAAVAAAAVAAASALPVALLLLAWRSAGRPGSWRQAGR